MGGNVFQDAVEFDHSQIPDIIRQVNKTMTPTGAKLIPIGSGATPTPGKKSGDLDVIVDQDALSQHFNVKDAKGAKAGIESLFQKAGYQTAKTGVSVHIRVPIDGGSAQVDVMVVPHAEMVSKYHIHNLPKGSPYKGKNKQLAMWWLAKQAGYNWSAFKGLVDADTKEVITRDLDEIAKMIIGPNASAKDFGSVESIMAALPDETAQTMLADLKQNSGWEEIKQETVDPYSPQWFREMMEWFK